MSDAVSSVTGTLPWGQEKKTETSSGSGSGSTTEPQPTTSEPTTSEPTTSEPTASEPTTSEPAATQPATAAPAPAKPAPAQPSPAAKTYSAPPSGNQVSPMPDRLRDLIIGYASQGATTRTPLIEFERIARSPASEMPPTAEQVRKTQAEIIANASVAMLAQANQTRDSVSALLNLSAAA